MNLFQTLFFIFLLITGGTMPLKQFRLYRYVGVKFQFFGLSLEQIFILLMGLMGFFMVSSFLFKGVIFILTSCFFCLQKKLTKRFEGVSLKAYTEWYLGLNVGLGDHFPSSSQRCIVGY